MWFMDAIALSDGTIGGAAEVLADKLPKLPREHRPDWMEGKTQKQITEIIQEAITEAYDVTLEVEEHVQRERQKGRPFEDIYAEVEPRIKEMSKAIDFKEQDKDDSEGLGLEPDDEILKPPASAAPNMEQNMEQQVRSAAERRRNAPHRRLGADPRPLHSKMSALVEEPDEIGSEPARCIDIHEPLLLVGTVNGFNIEDAVDLGHTFELCGTADPACQESKVRVVVEPDTDLEFQVVSARHLWQWVLFPGPGPKALQVGVRDHVAVRHAVDDEAKDEANARRFVIRKLGKRSEVDVHVSLSLERDIQVWFTEVA